MVGSKRSSVALLRQINGPTWRRRAVTEQLSSHRRRPPEWDAVTRRAADYLALCAIGDDGPSRARDADPEMAQAEAAWDLPTTRTALQTLVVADIAADEIAALLDLPMPIVELIESLYFDVRAMLGAPTWIYAWVVAPEESAGRQAAAARLHAAFFYGPVAAKALGQATLRLPTEPAEQLAEAMLVLHAKYLQALRLPLTDETTLEFLRLKSLIEIAEQRLKLDREKLQFRLRRWAQRYELAQARRAATEKNPSPVATQESAAEATAETQSSAPSSLATSSSPTSGDAP